MHVASLELCKELYELSGWRDTRFFYKAITGADYMVVAQPDYGKHRERPPTTYKWDESPAYSLDYLLDKLPHFIELVQLSGGYTPTGWRAIKESSQDYWHKGGPIEAEADNPTDAACKLAIELFKNNIIKKEGN